MSEITPCGTCLRAEFADDDYEYDETLLVPPGGKVGHLRRPKSSLVQNPFGAMVQAGRKEPHTYCGRQISNDWEKVPR